MDDRSFFGLLGFDTVESLDVSVFEGADRIHDLNLPIACDLEGRYDVVFNGGTLEHVFHLPNALRNVHRMLRTGGRAIHIAPASNQVDHGFYSFSPTLFHDYYAANRYEIRSSVLVEFVDWKAPWRVWDYAPGLLERLAGRLEASGILGLFVIAEKTASSTEDVVPQQGLYVSVWNQAAPSPALAIAPRAGWKGVLWRRIPRAAELLARLRRTIQSYMDLILPMARPRPRRL
ncbi:MAG: class I SAM-dependent methyltransferase [Planctomycetes bacterium]|nr:class I SAM-dependent methyltransferase [Planctomycetota bacterium]